MMQKDNEKVANNPKIKDQLQEKEIIKFSEKVFKFNKKNKKQERVICISTLFIYNLYPELTNFLGKIKYKF